MSAEVGERLTEPVRRFFDGTSLARKRSDAFLLLTVDADGTPRPCMLSVGEVLASSDRALRFALWPGTHTGMNLARGGQALFCFVTANAVQYLYGTPRALRAPSGAQLECFELAVDRVSDDEHPGMPVTSGLRFDVASGEWDDVMSGWQGQLDSLRRAE
jgi:hypothetical protein